MPDSVLVEWPCGTQLHVNIWLAFFVPGIVYLADAVGTQPETIVVRGLSLRVPIGRMIRASY